MQTVVAFALCVVLAAVAPACQADDRGELATRMCAALGDAVAAVPGGPLLLPSYRAAPGEPPIAEGLRDVAFVYDNALASIALFACERPDAARRIADALLLATSGDPEYHDGRVRNAYAAGPVAGPAPKLAGYWSAERQAWNQDAYQVSFATGNAAWTALALVTAYRRTRHAPYLAGARRALDWIATHCLDAREPAGFVGGYFVTPAGPVRQGWKSTEHNVDLVAAWTAVAAADRDSAAAARAAVALAFVKSQWNAAEGRFLIGTGDDGVTSDHDHSGLDAQIWPLIAVRDPPADWRRALAFVDATHAVAGGYGFDRAPQGVWTEGTAQVADVLVLRGPAARAAPLWTLLRRQQSANGWLYATPSARIETRLAIGPTSTTSDFHYDHVPHLGATAWAAIAARGANPFVPRQRRGRRASPQKTKGARGALDRSGETVRRRTTIRSRRWTSRSGS